MVSPSSAPHVLLGPLSTANYRDYIATWTIEDETTVTEMLPGKPLKVEGVRILKRGETIHRSDFVQPEKK